MISWITRLAFLLCLAVTVTSTPSSAQLEENLGGLSDENVQSYLQPLATGMAGTMSSAIFRTGNVPRVGIRFSVGVSAMAVDYGDDDFTYVPTDPAGFTSLEPTEVPTVVGDTEGVSVQGQSGLVQIYPGGFDLSSFQTIVPEATIGALAGTQLRVRWIAFDLGDADIGDFKYFGIGGQHSISQWIAGLPVDLAAGIFFQSFEIGDDVVKTNTVHLNVTASKSLGVIQPYVGLGYDTLEMNVKVKDEDGATLVDVTLDRENSAHLTVGTTAKLPVVSAFFEYNAAAATGFSLGITFGL